MTPIGPPSNIEPMQDPDETAICVERLSKSYRVPRGRKTTMYENIAGPLNGKHWRRDEYMALKDASFSVARGETFGIIGQSGSGKSTLLKILAGVLIADSGKVSINGKAAPFLPGVGFRPDLTAKENVYLYGVIMGLSWREMSRRYDDIVRLADLKGFENAKLKNLPTEMYWQLVYETAIQVNPDILLIDEVMAIGDMPFQKRCMERLKTFMESGKTVVLATHDIPVARQICRRSMLLRNGEVVMLGNTESVIEKFYAMMG